MRTNVEVDDELLERPRSLTSIEGRTDLVHASLRVLIERESARWLARLGGSDPELRTIRRRVCNEDT